MPFKSFSARIAESVPAAAFAALFCFTVVARGQAATAPADEQALDAASAATLASGQHFRISIPLRPSRAINLGTAQLDVTLSRSGKTKAASPDLHLLAIQTEAQNSLQAGSTMLMLHGVAPEFGPERAGDYHPSDYTVHLGSGNVTNIGVPDDTLIDTESLTRKLQALRLHLVAKARE